MVLKDYEDEVLLRMYDHDIIGHGSYTSIQKIAGVIKWQDLAREYRVKKGFSRVIRRLIRLGLVFDWGKSGRVASLTDQGVYYVRMKTRQ